MCRGSQRKQLIEHHCARAKRTTYDRKLTRKRTNERPERSRALAFPGITVFVICLLRCLWFVSGLRICSVFFFFCFAMEKGLWKREASGGQHFESRCPSEQPPVALGRLNAGFPNLPPAAANEKLAWSAASGSRVPRARCAPAAGLESSVQAVAAAAPGHIGKRYRSTKQRPERGPPARAAPPLPCPVPSVRAISLALVEIVANPKTCRGPLEDEIWLPHIYIRANINYGCSAPRYLKTSQPRQSLAGLRWPWRACA